MYGNGIHLVGIQQDECIQQDEMGQREAGTGGVGAGHGMLWRR